VASNNDPAQGLHTLKSGPGLVSIRLSVPSFSRVNAVRGQRRCRTCCRRTGAFVSCRMESCMARLHRNIEKCPSQATRQSFCRAHGHDQHIHTDHAMPSVAIARVYAMNVGLMRAKSRRRNLAFQNGSQVCHGISKGMGMGHGWVWG